MKKIELRTSHNTLVFRSEYSHNNLGMALHAYATSIQSRGLDTSEVRINNNELHCVKNLKVTGVITNLTFRYTHFIDCTFEKCMISQITFSGCAFTNCTFIDTNIEKCNFSGCKMMGIKLTDNSLLADTTIEISCFFFNPLILLNSGLYKTQVSSENLIVITE